MPKLVRAKGQANRGITKIEVAMTTRTSPPIAAELITRPVAATIAAVFHEGRILLVRRANPPDAGRWGFPGGKIDVGEPIEAAAVRELLEETGVHAEPRQVFTAVDVFDCDESGWLRQHFILVAVLCEWRSGDPVAGDDALEARWFRLDELDEAQVALSLDVARVARQAALISTMSGIE